MTGSGHSAAVSVIPQCVRREEIVAVLPGP